jgi:hypothetical protein
MSNLGGYSKNMKQWNSIKDMEFTKPIKIWKPSLIEKILIRLKIIKDRRYNGKKINYCLLDEAGQFSSSRNNFT